MGVAMTLQSGPCVADSVALLSHSVCTHALKSSPLTLRVDSALRRYRLSTDEALPVVLPLQGSGLTRKRQACPTFSLSKRTYHMHMKIRMQHYVLQDSGMTKGFACVGMW